MITFILLMIIALALAIVLAIIAAVGGAGFVMVFGDAIICVLLIIGIIKFTRFLKNRKK